MITPRSGKWWALGAVMLAILAVGLDGTVVSVALPTLANKLGASESDLQWFSSGYLLVLAAAMLPSGLLGDRFGRKKVMAVGLLLFALASAGCALSRTPGEFIAARLFLGLAGAPLIVMAVSALAVLFTDEERPRAVGIWAAVNFIALPIGPIVGGWLLTHAWWGWVFLMNVPVALGALLAVVLLVPETQAAERPRLDPVGVVASSCGLVGLTYGLIEAGQNGWSSIGALGPMVAGLAILFGFVLWELALGRRPGGQPLVDLNLFRSRSFSWGLALMTLSVVTMVGALFTLPQYFQGIAGADPMGSGLRLLPLIGGLVVGAVPGARVMKWLGPKVMIAIGFSLLGGGLVVGSATGVDSGAGFVAGWMAVMGLGLGLVFVPTAGAAIGQLSPERSGVTGGVFMAVQKTGAPFGAAIFGSIVSSGYLGELHLGHLPASAASAVRASLFGGITVAHQLDSSTLLRAVEAAFVHGMDAALVVSAGLAGVGVVLALAFMPLRTPTPAARDAQAKPLASPAVTASAASKT
ncbi:MAG: DHA2 family efflux MFS transporter permease subunit [Candidatus Dormibacteria bacterium]